MKLAVMQPYFFPYLGYFQLIAAADQFILLDDVQYIRHGWINRNRILKPVEGHQYIIAPLAKHSQKANIKEVQVIEGEAWKIRILRQLEHYRKKAPFYKTVVSFLEDCFSCTEKKIAILNAFYLNKVCGYLDLSKEIQLASGMKLNYDAVAAKDEWALTISQQLQVQEYINPVGGAALFTAGKFAGANIKLCFLKPALNPYKQENRAFEPGLSIIDVMMFNAPEAIQIMLKQYELV